MSCPQFVIWSPVPGGSTIRARATGDSTAYNATIAIVRNGEAEEPMRHAELTAGATRPFAAGDQFVFDPNIVLFRDVPQEVTLELRIEDANGNPVMVHKSGGGTRPAQCSWSISKVKLSPMLAEVIAG